MCQPQSRGGGKQLLIHGLYYSLCLVTQMLSLVAPFTLEDFSPCVCLRNTFRPLTHKAKLIHFSFHAMKTKSLLNINVYMKSCLKLQFYQASYLTKLFNLLINNIMNTLNNIWIQTHTHVVFYGLLGLSIGVMVFILYKLYVLLPYTYPTPKLSPHRRRCISTFPPKYSLYMIYECFELWGHWKCPHKSPFPCNTCVIPMSLYKFVSS